jgi:hypothetical protein
MFLLLQNADIKNRILSIEIRNDVLVTTHSSQPLSLIKVILLLQGLLVTFLFKRLNNHFRTIYKIIHSILHTVYRMRIQNY